MANNLPDFFIFLIVACVSLSVIPGGTCTDDITHSDVSDVELSEVKDGPWSYSDSNNDPNPDPNDSSTPSTAIHAQPEDTTTTSTTTTSTTTTSTTPTTTTSTTPTTTTSTTPTTTTSTTPTTTTSTTPTTTTSTTPTTTTSTAPTTTTSPSSITTTSPSPASTTVSGMSTQTTTPQGPPESTSAAPQPTTTQHPILNKKQVLDKTDDIIVNITGTINEFEKALSDVIPTTTVKAITTTSSKANEEFIARHLSDLAHIWTEVTDGDRMCLSPNTKCTELETTLNTIDQQLDFLKDNVDQWNQTRMEYLEILSLDLCSRMSYATDPAFINVNINVTATNTKLQGISKKAEEAKDVVENEINDLSDGVIFTAVFGTLGGLIIISLIAGLAYAVIKGRKSKKPKTKAYKEVQEQNIPIDGFLHDHDNMAYEDDETTKPRNDAYPLRPFNKPAPPPKDPYSHPKERSVDDLYARPLKSKNPEAPPRATNYSRSEYDRDHRHDPKPSTSADDYYSRPSSSRDDYYSTPEAPQEEKYYNERGSSRPYDPYAAPVSKDPAPRGGLRRFN